MEHFIDWVIRQNIELTILICLILLVRISFKKILAPKAIHLLWLIVLIKSVSYFNVPYVSTKQEVAKSEIRNTSSNAFSNQEINLKSNTQPSVLIENDTQPMENIKLASPKNEKAMKIEVAPQLIDSTINYFTAKKIKTILVWSYLLVLTALLVHLLISFVSVRSLKKGGSQNDLLTNKLQALKTKLKIKSKIEIVESNMIPSPTLIGIISFTILIPSNILGNISNANLEDIITHELMHIKRKDTLVNLIFRFVACLYFYNLFIWIAYYLMKKDMESACDQDVLIKSDFKNNISYAESLLLITKLCKQNGQVNHHAMMFIHKNTFKRIDMITNLKKTGILSRIMLTVTLIFALIVFVPSYRVISEEAKIENEIDKIIINLENKDYESSEELLNKQLKDILMVKNIFVLDGPNLYLNLHNIKFNGAFNQFKDLILKDQKINTIYYKGSLYFTDIDEKSLLSMLEGINKFKNKDSELYKKLNTKIASIAFNGSNFNDAIKKIGKEVELEIEVQLDERINFRLEQIKINKTYNDISAWDILTSLTYFLKEDCSFELEDGKISFVVKWIKIYNEFLQKQIVVEKNEFTLFDFLQTIRTKFPEIQVVIKKQALDDLNINDQIKIKLNKKIGMFGEMLNEALEQINMGYQLESQALIVTSKKEIDESILWKKENKYFNEIGKKLSLSTNKSENEKQKDVKILIKQPVTFDFTNTLLKDGLKELSVMTNISIIYKAGVINDDNNYPIQMVSNGMSFINALRWILANADLEYRIFENSIVIQKKSFVEIPATFVELQKALPNLGNENQNKNENLIVIKPGGDIKLNKDKIDVIKIDNGDPSSNSIFEIVYVGNNFILVKITKGNILPGTACTIYYRE